MLFRRTLSSSPSVRTSSSTERSAAEGDHAPCPMCSPNKFLSRVTGSTFRQCSAAAIIGHRCAGRESRAAAAREYTWRTKRDHEESYLLNNLALVPARMKVLQELEPVCMEARRLYRRLRKRLPQDPAPAARGQAQSRRPLGSDRKSFAVARRMRIMTTAGPLAFKGRSSDIETREHDFGISLARQRQ
mgnify:CR=1 FL=1